VKYEGEENSIVRQKYREKNETGYNTPKSKENKFCFLAIHVEMLSM
jgi:hypothetical protein